MITPAKVAAQNRTRPKPYSRWLTFPTITVFILPLLTVGTVNLIGSLMFSDLAVLILTPFLLFSKRFHLQQPYLKPILGMLVLWFVGAVASDLINNTPSQSFLRGWATIFFFALHLIAFFSLIDGREERLVSAIMGGAAATLLAWALGITETSSEILTDTPWKLGGGSAVTILIAGLLGFYLPKRLVGQLSLIISPIHLFLNARSLFLTTVFSSAATIFSLKARNKRQRLIVLSAVGAGIITILPIAEGLYGELTSAGTFGEKAKEKYNEQTANGTINILLAGRSESLISVRAIYDAPIFGHGSWAQNKKYFYEYVLALRKMGRNAMYRVPTDGTFLIPAHSLLLQAWIFSGIFGAAFWIMILVLNLRAIGYSIIGAGTVPVIFNIVIFTLLWDIFFSPFGQERRCYEAVYIATICNLIAWHRGKLNARKGDLR
jgi:hypothetical protein